MLMQALIKLTQCVNVFKKINASTALIYITPVCRATEAQQHNGYAILSYKIWKATLTRWAFFNSSG